MTFKFPLIFTIVVAFFAGIARAEVPMPGPMLSQDEINAMTMTPEEYEDQFDEDIEDGDVDGDNPNTCGLSSNTPEAREFLNRILGPWKMSHLAGFATMGGMTFPYPGAGDNEVVTFKRVGPRLYGFHPKAIKPMRFYWPNEDTWRFMPHDNALFPAPGLNSEDLELVQGCEIIEMPRLIGRTSMVVEGVEMNFTYRLIIIQEGLMYGIMHLNGVFNGMSFFSARTVVLNR